MLNYQSLSFHDILAVRTALGLEPAPEFARWLERQGVVDGQGRTRAFAGGPAVDRLLGYQGARNVA
jgi:ethanolamine ammonia-lyase large subunit